MMDLPIGVIQEVSVTNLQYTALGLRSCISGLRRTTTDLR